MLTIKEFLTINQFMIFITLLANVLEVCSSVWTII